MTLLDPTTPNIETINVFDGELSVEVTAQIQAHEGMDPTAVVAGDAEALELAQAVDHSPTSILRKQKVSGRYRSGGSGFQLELRIDVDRSHPMRRVSGDYYSVSGATVNYFGSFMVNEPTISVTSSKVTITGIGTYTFNAGAPKVKITIPRVPTWRPLAPATLQHFTLADTPGTTYVCSFESRYFRTVEIEEDRVIDITPFVSYDTGLLPSGGPARTLSVVAAYAEAGIEMRLTGGSDVVPPSEAGVTPSWSNAELHAAMLNHFSLWQDEPQWKVWLLHAQLHDIGSGLLGIMFDQQGRQRQGAATFYQSLAGTTPDRLRAQLYTCVHELGHCFNLFHSFHKEFMTPPMPNRLDALSWMNYPQRYPLGGEAGFWAAFPFQFDDLELIHLRHAFRDNIIIGGNPFGTGAALESPNGFKNPIKDNSGLLLELRAPKSFAYGEPPVVEIKLSMTDTRGKRVHSYLHPNFGFVQIGICKPSGQMMTYRPLLEHCVADTATVLDENRPAIYESAYIGYGKDGFYFDQPGFYRLRAIYFALDGSQVLSNVLTLRVRHPLNLADEEVADLFFGEDQGTLLYLLGSDSQFLQSGNEAFNLVLDKYTEHPLAVYAQLVKGINATREFKTITTDNKVEVRKPRYNEANELLSSVIDASEAGQGVDNITLNMTMQCLASAQIDAGDEEGARATAERMVDIFRKKSLRPQVLNFIKAQAAEITAALSPQPKRRSK